MYDRVKSLETLYADMMLKVIWSHVVFTDMRCGPVKVMQWYGLQTTWMQCTMFTILPAHHGSMHASSTLRLLYFFSIVYLYIPTCKASDLTSDSTWLRMCVILQEVQQIILTADIFHGLASSPVIHLMHLRLVNVVSDYSHVLYTRS